MLTIVLNPLVKKYEKLKSGVCIIFGFTVFVHVCVCMCDFNSSLQIYYFGMERISKA